MRRPYSNNTFFNLTSYGPFYSFIFHLIYLLGKMFTLTDLVLKITKDHETCIRWCQENGLIRTNRTCDICYDDMSLRIQAHKQSIEWRSYSTWYVKKCCNKYLIWEIKTIYEESYDNYVHFCSRLDKLWKFNTWNISSNNISMNWILPWCLFRLVGQLYEQRRFTQ